MLDNTIKDKLYDYQINHTERLIKIIKENTTVLDASDTGTGKTYCAAALCKHLNLKPFIICPKSVIYTWRSVCKLFDVEPYGVVNYETAKIGKYYNKDDKRVICPYLDIVIGEKRDMVDVNWKIKKDAIFIFDEVHKCSGMGTHNSILLYTAYNTGNKLMMLSATVADNPQKFLLFTYILKFLDPTQILEKGTDFRKYIRIIDDWLNRDKKPMIKLHHMLYPERASRIRIADLGDKFPETQIVAEPYFISEKKRKMIQIEYKKIYEELDKIDRKEIDDKRNILVKILRSHQKIELLKIPTFIELANDFIENGFSVVIFVNFTQTLKSIAKMLNTDCLIYGDQTKEERDRNITRFMNNKVKIIVCNIKAGGVGVSLHDLHGGHPRASLLSPTWSSIDMVQALGRVHRAGGKSKSVQRIVYIAKTVEEQISDKIRKKLDNINSINNGDLDLTGIDFVDKKFNQQI